MKRNNRHWLAVQSMNLGWRYGTAVFSTGLAILGRTLLEPWLREECPFSLFYLSVLLTAWIAGTGPSILAIVLGTLSAAHFFISPEASLYIEDFPDIVQLVIYVLVNCVATLLFDRVERQRQLAENRSVENEQLSHSLRVADERKDEFLALLAHELRNPLAPIRSSLALLDRKGDSREVVQRVCSVVQRQTNHLVRITDDLLDVSRFCRGKVELRVCRMDLRESIDDAIEITESFVNEKSHRFQLLTPSAPVWVNGDRVRLSQLFSNLIGNAAKYTSEGGRITVQVEVQEHEVTIAVSDNGIGFAPSEAARIMEPFMQIDMSRTREYGGLGVGLTIVNRLVALHCGSVDAHSRGPGMGSCFTVKLPCAAPDEEELLTSTTTVRTVSTAGNETSECSEITALSSEVHQRRSVLIVEDNVDASLLLAELFESEDYEVRVASEGIEALQMISQRCPDVAILDIGLPGMDGYELARRIRRSSSACDTKLIALTGWGGPTDRELAVEAGFDVHLVKPIVFQELLGHAAASASNETTVDVCRQATFV